MKARIAMLLLGGLLAGHVLAQPVASPAVFSHRTPVIQLTPAAAKCDLASCQQNCYVEGSHCNTRDGGACSSKTQMCVQNCASQCK